MLTSSNNLHKEGLKIVKLYQAQGFKAFWVGGTVRDLLLKRHSDNLDVATSATPEQSRKILRDAKYYSKSVGEKYGTILAATKSGPIEITTFRNEDKYVGRRKPQSVVYIDSLEEDAKRRDFTINAIYYDPVTKELHDPENGQLDLNRKLIKFVGDPKKRIDEDALRMLRAVRFSVQLGYKIERNSFAAIKTRAKYIQQISGERIKAEIDKILLSENRVLGIRLLDEIGLLQFIMPEVVALKNVWHKSKVYHLEGSAFEHVMLVLQHTLPGNLPLAYAALYHDTGKASTAIPKMKYGDLVNSFPNHEFVSADLFKKFAKRLRFSREEMDITLWITKMHMSRVAFGRDMRDEKKIQLAKHKYFPMLIQLWRADQQGKLVNVKGKIVPGESHSYKEGLNLLRKIQSKKKIIEKIVKGDFIMNETKISSGPKVGVIKNDLENKIIHGKIKNISDAKKYLKKFVKNT